MTVRDGSTGEPERVRRRRGWVGLGVVLVAAVALVWLRRGEAGTGGEGETPTVAASTAVVEIRDFPITVPALGTVVPGPGAEARPSAPAPTRVTRVFVAQGDTVREGQPLIGLDASVFAARLEEAEAALASAGEARSRQERLVERGIAPRKDLEAAAAELARARAEVAEARRNRDLATVRSPIRGVVTAVFVTLGEPVEGSQPLVDVIDPDGLVILFRLAPGDAARVLPGAPVDLVGAGDGEAPGGGLAPAGRATVAGVSAAVDSATGGVAVRAVVADLERRLLAGESVVGRITVGVQRDAVIVPLAALVPDEEGLHVFVVDETGVAHRTPVVVDRRSDREASVISGLRGGERVVTDGAYGVGDGARIRSDDA